MQEIVTLNLGEGLVPQALTVAKERGFQVTVSGASHTGAVLIFTIEGELEVLMPGAEELEEVVSFSLLEPGIVPTLANLAVAQGVDVLCEGGDNAVDLHFAADGTLTLLQDDEASADPPWETESVFIPDTVMRGEDGQPLAFRLVLPGALMQAIHRCRDEKGLSSPSFGISLTPGTKARVDHIAATKATSRSAVVRALVEYAFETVEAAQTRIPNATTEAALQDLEEGKGEKFDTVEALLQDCGIEESAGGNPADRDGDQA